MIYNKVHVQLGEERHITLDPINYQYDVKQILVISGETVPEYYEADICNVGDTATLTMIGTAEDGVEIPDKFFRDGRNVLVYVVIPGSGGDVQTRYDITIPSDERGERTDIELDTDQQTQADSLIAALNSGVGRAEAAVTHYPKIVDGYWYVWNAETETWVNTEIRAEGRDGYSPEVTITEIEGGHRVTITDEDHPQGQTFDVMDGQGGSTGDYDELTNRPRINGHTLTGNQSASDLGLGTYSKPADGIPKTDLAQDVQQSLRKADTALQTAPVQSVAGKTGAVNLGAGDVGFDSSEEYNEGTVGAELSELNRQLSDLDGDVADTQGMLAMVEATATASRNYSVGDLLIYDGKLYKVISAIATGATIIVGSNVTQTTVESQIAAGGGGGGGSEKTWRKFRDVTVTLEKPTSNVTYTEGADGITQFSFSVDDDGNSFEFTDIKILAIVKNITGAGLVTMYSGTRQQNIAIMTFRGTGTQGQARVYEFESILIDGARFYSGIYGTQYATTINQLAPNQIVNNLAFGGDYNKFINGFVNTSSLFKKVNMITIFFNDATVEGRFIFFGK